ncbi:MAG: M20/M25/M40 family metallo-hydrolase [Candidatus Aminicenantes bacterium]|nr:M20/M25/M40 family metallo-hydrolase [Candidatus Aminicenantes bacterium]
MSKYFLPIAISLVITLSGCSAKKDTEVFADIYKTAAGDTSSYQTLRVLCKNYPNRLCGTLLSIQAIRYMKGVMAQEGFDRVYLQECSVAHWQRGSQEVGAIRSKKFGETKLSLCALGNSVGTAVNGLQAGVVEVASFEQLAKLGEKAVKGKIIFFNKTMDPGKANTFEAYGEVVSLRFAGASVAARYGAEAVVIRSITTAVDTFPHTGVMRYRDTPKQIPAFALATAYADIVSKQLAADPKLKLFLKSDCKLLADEKSFNLIGEVRGSEFADEIITVGGHIDAWDITEGAHDDGGGCVQAIAVWKIFRAIGYRPKRTLRVVLFMDEELNQRGGKKYAAAALLKKEKHLFALESDGGCDRPIGFSFDTKKEYLAKFQSYRNLFAPYGVTLFINEGSGVDVGFLKEQNAVLGELLADPGHYFDYHHSGYDTFERVNKDYLNQGSATLASLIYLFDKYGLR